MDKQEKIVCAAIQCEVNNQDDWVYEIAGVDYASIRSTQFYSYAYDADITDEKEGFITSKNRFVDAKEAYKIAVEARQIPSKRSLMIDIDYRIIKAKNSKNYHSATSIKELETEQEIIANKPEILRPEDLY